MADERLVNYIRDNLHRGYSPDSLRQTLLNQGWDTNQINEAFAVVQGSAPDISQTSAGTPSRPTGVTIICVLGFISAVFSLVSGILFIGVSSLFGGMGSVSFGNETASMVVDMGIFGTLFGMLGYILIIIAIVGFVGFYLLLKMKKIGWILTTVIGIIFMTLNILNFSLTSILVIVFWAVIIGYLFTKRKLFV